MAHSSLRDWLPTSNKEPTSPAIREFAQANRPNWSKTSSPSSTGTVLVDATLNHPGYLMSNFIIANHLAEHHDLSLGCLVDGVDDEIRVVGQSYGATVFFDLKDRYFNSTAGWLWDGLRLCNSLSSPDDILNLEYDGIPIGDLVYNSYLRGHGRGTMEKIDFTVYRHVLSAISMIHYYRTIFEQSDIDFAVVAEIFYIRCGLLMRTALSNEVPVYVRKLGPRRFTVRRYTNLREARTNELRPTQELFDYIYENHRNQAIKEAEDYLSKRLDGNIDEVDAKAAYGGSQSTVTKEEFCSRYDLDPSKPIAVIMMHVFSDAPHSHHGMIFRDYWTWLLETLQFAASTPEVNWVVKPHPAADRYGCPSTKSAISEVQLPRDSPIYVLNENINTSSMIDISDVILTVRGTAGIEFSCYGVPAVTAGKNRYSEFGFTHTAETKSEYFDLLNSLSSINELSTGEMTRAKVFAYIYFHLFPVKSDLIPAHPRTTDFSYDTIWREAAGKCDDIDVKDDALTKPIQTFLRSKSRHLLNFSELNPTNIQHADDAF